MRTLTATLLLSTTLGLAACANFDREAGAQVDSGTFGNATMNNTMLQTGELSYTIALAERFAKEVPSTVNFAFNSAALSPEAQGVLRRQAAWIRQFPEVRFKVFGHTDLVGSHSYNQALGLRRAKAVVNFLTQNGVSRSRLEAVVSYGKTQPLIATNQAEVRNRRTLTEVSGWVKNHPAVLNGKYAAVVWRTYSTGIPSDPGLAARPHPVPSDIQTNVNPAGN